MIRGEVTPNREAVVGLSLRGASGESVLLDAVLDTGFTEHLALPASVILRLGWPKLYTDRMMLADRSITVFDVHEGVIDWHGHERSIEVHAADELLLGMALLRGSRVILDVVDGGRVTIDPLTLS